MALYVDLFQLANDDVVFRNRVTVACVVAAEAVRTEADTTANHVNRLAWAARVYADPVGESRRMLWAVLAQNAGATVAQITGATDGTIQSAVNAAVNVFATGA